MGKAKDAAGNIWETDAQGNAVRLIQPASSNPMNNPMADPRLQYQVQSAQWQAAAAPYEAPKAQVDIARTQQQIAAQPIQNANTVANTQQSIASIQNQKLQRLQGLRQEFNALPEVKSYSDAIASLGGALKAPNTPQGDLSIVYSFAKAMDPGSVVREGEMDMANSTASQTQQLQQYVNAIQAGKRLPPAVRTGLVETMRQRVAAMRQTYDQQRSRYADAAKSQGFDPEQVVGKPLYDAVRPLEENYIKSHGGTPRDPNAPQTVAADQDIGFNAGGQPKNPMSSEQQAAFDAWIKANPNANADQLNQFSKSIGLAGGIANADDYLKALKEGRAYGANMAIPQMDPRAQQKIDQMMQSGGTGGSAAVAGFGDAASLGFMDELGAAAQSLGQPGSFSDNYNVNAAANRGYLNQLQKVDNGVPYFGGQLAGGVAAGGGLAGGLSKIPALEGSAFGMTKDANPILSNVLSKEGMAGDALYGAGYGAGSSDNNRVNGALLGGMFGAGGGAAARGTIGAAASAISPTGGKLAPLYAMGVRPSIGQRLGGVANTLEEKFQSIPLVGDAIAGTRDRARNQFQVGLFNDALGQVGQELPKGVGPGHAAHAFAQDAISNAYDGALSNMTAAADPQLGTDIGALQRQVGTLKPDSKTQFSKIWDDSVGRRFKLGNGAISGPAYKDAESEISKKIAAIRSNPTGDGELADALEQARDALRGSALRNSPPEAVKALDAADAAHARIVRIETASRSAGGDPAEFSPKQYNNAVRTASGGVRNRNYLRGDALNSEVAALGTRLGDKVSNSGTVDRLAAGAALTGAGYVHPAAAAAFGALGALNAPGVRNVVTEAMAPKANPLFDRAAEQLRQRARVAGMFGAPLAIDYFAQQ